MSHGRPWATCVQPRAVCWGFEVLSLRPLGDSRIDRLAPALRFHAPQLAEALLVLLDLQLILLDLPAAATREPACLSRFGAPAVGAFLAGVSGSCESAVAFGVGVAVPARGTTVRASSGGGGGDDDVAGGILPARKPTPNHMSATSAVLPNDRRNIVPACDETDSERDDGAESASAPDDDDTEFVSAPAEGAGAPSSHTRPPSASTNPPASATARSPPAAARVAREPPLERRGQPDGAPAEVPAELAVGRGAPPTPRAWAATGARRPRASGGARPRAPSGARGSAWPRRAAPRTCARCRRSPR